MGKGLDPLSAPIIRKGYRGCGGNLPGDHQRNRLRQIVFQCNNQMGLSRINRQQRAWNGHCAIMGAKRYILSKSPHVYLPTIRHRYGRSICSQKYFRYRMQVCGQQKHQDQEY